MQRNPDKRPSFNELVFRTRAGSEAVSAAGSAQHGIANSGGVGNGGDSVAIAVVAGGGAVAAAADVKQQSINAGFEEDV